MEEKYGRLTPIKKVDTPIGKSNQSVYILCKCDCGNEKIIAKQSLRSGKAKSCGCLRKEKQSEKAKAQKTHGLSKTRFYKILTHMKNRCYNEDYNEFHLYGGRGIEVCERWHNFENFKDDMYDSYVEFEKLHGKNTATIDRIDPNGNYEPSNCEWKTLQEQARNRRNNISVEVDGVVYNTLKELSEETLITYATLIYRYKSGKRGNDLIAPKKNQTTENE